MAWIKRISIIMVVLAVLAYFLITDDLPIEYLKQKYTNSQSKFVEIDGINFHYRDEKLGKSAVEENLCRDDCPPIILIHGTSSSLHTWDDWTEILTKKGFRVIRFDLPAFGLTGPAADDNYTIEAYTKYLDKFMSFLAIEKAVIIGNSLGGQVAWNFAVDYPSKVSTLVIICAAGFPMGSIPFAFQLAKLPFVNMIVEYILPYSLFKRSLSEVYYDKSRIREGIIDRYYELSLRPGNRKALISRLKGRMFLSMEENKERLKKIKQPTLIMWGEHDRWIPVENAHLFHSSINNSELQIYPKAGHIPMEELPEETADGFLNYFVHN